MTTTIAGILGSVRRDSYNRLLLNAAARMLAADVELMIADMLDRIPPFNEDWEAEPAPVAVAQLRRVIAESDALLIATPEYNGSIPSQLKNALDWASRPRGSAALQGKPAAVISAALAAGERHRLPPTCAAYCPSRVQQSSKPDWRCPAYSPSSPRMVSWPIPRSSVSCTSF